MEAMSQAERQHAAAQASGLPRSDIDTIRDMLVRAGVPAITGQRWADGAFGVAVGKGLMFFHPDGSLKSIV